jgi:hypothetical protein
VPVDLTSIDVDEYRAGLNGGPQGDDGEDLGIADLFGVVDGDDCVGMATPCSTATPTVTPTSTSTLTTTPTAIATPMPPQGPGQKTRTTSTTWTQAQVRNRKTRA